MEVQVSKDNICINKLLCEKKELVFVEEDIIVPDTKPDILNAININGNVCTYKKELQEDKVRLEGSVDTYIMYLPDSKEDNLRALKANVDFSKSINVKGCKEGMILICDSLIKDMECKVLNGRKVKVKIGIEFTIKLYSNEEVEIINRINNVEDIQTLDENFNINSLIGNGSTRVYVKDTLNIEQNDEIAEVLKTDINLVDSDIKTSYNKVLAKSEASIKIMYLTEDNRINFVEGKIPVVGFIDMPNINEENICDTNYELKNIMIRPNPSEEHSIYVELEYEVMCMTYEKKSLNLIQDLYSPTMSLKFNQKNIATTTQKIILEKSFNITSKINIEELKDGDVLDVEVCPNLHKEKIENNKIIYEGELSVNFIFSTGENNSNINSKVSKLPFEFESSTDDVCDLDNINTRAVVLSKKFDKKSDGDIDCNIEVGFRTEINKNANINIIDNIEFSDDRESTDEYDSLVLYIVMPGDTLWKIAKRFNTTIDEIAITNGIEDRNKIYAGQKLYIPKFKYMTRKNSINEVSEHIM